MEEKKDVRMSYVRPELKIRVPVRKGFMLHSITLKLEVRCHIYALTADREGASSDEEYDVFVVRLSDTLLDVSLYGGVEFTATYIHDETTHVCRFINH